MERLLFSVGSKAQPYTCKFFTVFLAGIEIVIFPSITLWVEGVQLCEIKVLGNLWCIWEFMVLCQRRRKGICTCGIVMENSVVSCSQLGENTFIVSVHSNSICPCALTTSSWVFCSRKLSEKRAKKTLEKVWKSVWALRIMPVFCRNGKHSFLGHI